jgi:hypothetical protein
MAIGLWGGNRRAGAIIVAAGCYLSVKEGGNRGMRRGLRGVPADEVGDQGFI